MRVGLVCDAFVPENKAVAIRMNAIANAFARKGIQVRVLTSTKPEESQSFLVRQNWLPGPSNESGVIVRLSNELLLGVEVFFRILFSRFELVVISSPPFFTSFCVFLACMLRRIPYALDVRDEYPEVYFAAGLTTPTSLPGRLLLWMERIMYKNAILVITVTEGICDRIKAKSTVSPYLLRNGFDASLFKPVKEKEQVFTLVFHGNIGKFQNPELILSLAEGAFKAELPIQIWIIGKGNNDVVVQQSKWPNIKYFGEVDYQKIPGLIARAHLGISFRSEDIISKNSFPVKLYEYIGVGLPMLVTPISEAGDLIEKLGMGFQFSGNEVDRIVGKVKELCTNTEAYADLAARVLKHRAAFSREESCDSLVQYLLTRLNERNG